MTPELKSKWIAALRSGKFVQGRACLRDLADEYCCLGVLGTLIEGAVWQRREELCSYHTLFIDDQPLTSAFNESTLNQIGLSVNHQSILIVKNDNGESFLSIANWIENRDDL